MCVGGGKKALRLRGGCRIKVHIHPIGVLNPLPGKRFLLAAPLSPGITCLTLDGEAWLLDDVSEREVVQTLPIQTNSAILWDRLQALWGVFVLFTD